MILLDELDFKDNDLKQHRESLPPYSPSPRRSHRIPRIAAPPRGPANAHAHSNRRHRPRPQSPPRVSSTCAQSNTSLTLNGGVSSQTLIANSLPTPPPSAPLSGPGQSTPRPASSLSSSFSSLSLPSNPFRPPRHLRPSNTVFVQRDAAAIRGSYLIDPSLQIPECLLPDDPDALLVPNGNGKGKQKRSNISLVTLSGDILVDIWIRQGCAHHLQKRKRENANKEPARMRRGGGSSIDGSSSTTSRNGSSSLSASGSARDLSDSADDVEYWRMDWTSPPSNMPWPDKTMECVDIDVRSETGSIEVRIHAQSHQRVRIHATSAHGSIAIGIPRTFAGQITANAHTTASSARSDSASSISSSSFMSTTTLSTNNNSVLSFPRFRSPSVSYIPSFGFTASEKEKAAKVADELVRSIVPDFLPNLKCPVAFSPGVEGVISVVNEQRKSGKGRYLVGDDPTRLISEHLGDRSFDELSLETFTGQLGVFCNDEIPQFKSDNGIITKFLAW